MSVTYLSVSAHEKDRAIALGARKDPKSGQLFVPTGLSLSLFQPWLPQPVAASALASATQPGLSLSALLTRCSAAIKSAFLEPVWVRIEVSQIKFSGGHLYLAAIERAEESGKEVAKTTAMVWSSNVTRLVQKFSSATGMELAAGIQILVLVKPEFRPQYGMGLQIVDIDPSYTLGDREARLKRIHEALEASGDAGKNRSLASPDDFRHVCVISPDGAAGLEDFQVEANRLAQANLCRFTYIKAIFQGEKTKESMKHAFLEAHNAHGSTPFCALAMIRGGGAAADLHWLDDYLIARMVCRFRAPVLTGIGHERDQSVVDAYAHKAFGTPSKVIAHIKDIIFKKAMNGYGDWSFIAQTAAARLDSAKAKIDMCTAEIDANADKLLSRAEFASDRHLAAINADAVTSIQRADLKADLLNSEIGNAAASALDLASRNAEHLFAVFKDTATAKLQAVAVKANNDFASITLAARRSIDGVDQHLDDQFDGIVGSTTRFISGAESNADRHLADTRFYASKMLSDAENGSRDLMSNIMAHGVEPTLKRGFAVVKNAQGPVSTKAAAEASASLEITFRDGTMKISKVE
ncbi:MAG: Exodeoxyribonuclease 7 large subunit [Herminiimonas sp.]|nr:Exodeoxyribonuclease 7 large subunit [Herminiimonas sp.]